MNVISSFFFLFLILIQINFLFSDNICSLKKDSKYIILHNLLYKSLTPFTFEYYTVIKLVFCIAYFPLTKLNLEIASKYFCNEIVTIY